MKLSNIDLIKLFNEHNVVQNYREIKWLVDKVQKIIEDNTKQNKPSTIIEIGVQSGGTMKIWEQLLAKSGKQDNLKDNILIGIDLGNTIAWDITKSDIYVQMIIGNSHDIETLRLVKRVLFDEFLFERKTLRQPDFVYIDGEHTPDAVKRDFNMYGKLVLDGGGIGFHDYYDVKQFLDILPRNKLEIFIDKPPFEPIGPASGIGTAFYRKE